MARTRNYLPWYMGFDPGNDGGMYLINSHGHTVLFDRINELPSIVDFFIQAKIAASVQLAQIICIFEEFKGEQAAHAARHSGMYVGIVMTLCHVHGIRFERTAPQTWKNHHGLIIRQGKDIPESQRLSEQERYQESKRRSQARFKELYPDINIIFPRCRKEHEGVAEAGLIASYGLQKGL